MTRAGIVLLSVLLTGVAGAAPDWARAVFPSGDEFQLEVASDASSRRIGYMYRDEVGPRDGMLFLFDAPDRHAIWMKNCRVSLDILWLDEGFRVVEIAANRPPCPAEGDCPLIVPMRVSPYVLELAAGTAAAQGLAPGSRLIIISDPAIP